MSWFWWALICPVCWAVSNIIDQFLARDYFKNQTTSYVIMTGLTALPFVIPFALWKPELLFLPIEAIGWILFSSVFYILSLYPYMAALKDDDVSIVVPILRLTPLLVIGFAAIFLGETLTIEQLIIGGVILVAAIGISWSFEKKTLRLSTFLLTFMACICFAIHTVILRYCTLNISVTAIIFWDILGWLLAGVILIPVIPSARKHAFDLIRTTHGKVYAWSFLQNGLDVIATLCAIIALSTAPSAGLMALTGSLHPAITFVLSGLLAIFVPRLFEPLRFNRETALKTICIAVMIGGYYALYSSGLIIE